MGKITSDWMSGSSYKRVSAVKKFWEEIEKTEFSLDSKHPFITISRDYGVRGTEVAELVEKKLNERENDHPTWKIFDDEIMQEMQVDKKFLNYLDTYKNKIEEFVESWFESIPHRSKVFRDLSKTLISIACKGYSIIIGRGGAILTRNLHGGFNVRLIDTWKNRVNRMMELKNFESYEEAEKFVEKNHKEREAFVKEFTGRGVYEQIYYDLIINLNHLNPEQAANIIVEGVKQRFGKAVE